MFRLVLAVLLLFGVRWLPPWPTGFFVMTAASLLVAWVLRRLLRPHARATVRYLESLGSWLPAGAFFSTVLVLVYLAVLFAASWNPQGLSPREYGFLGLVLLLAGARPSLDREQRFGALGAAVPLLAAALVPDPLMTAALLNLGGLVVLLALLRGYLSPGNAAGSSDRA